MRKSYKVYMILENGDEVYLEKCSDEERAKGKCELYARQDEYERQIGYYCPNTKYIYKKAQSLPIKALRKR